MSDRPPTRPAGRPAAPPTRPTPTAPSSRPTTGARPGSAAAEQLARAQMLSEVMGHIVETSKAPPPKKKRGPWLQLSVIVVGVAFTAYAWLVRPAWLWGDATRPVPPREARANERFAIWVLAEQIDHYRATRGTLPPSLAALGDSVPDVTYRRIDSASFELRGSAAGDAIVYRSGESADAFLVSATSVVRHGGR